MDLRLLFMSNTIGFILLSIYIVTIFYKNRGNKKVLYITNFVLLYCVGFIFFVLRNEIPDFLSIVVANTLFAFGSMNLYIAIKLILDLETRWSLRHMVPVFIIFFGHFIFTYVDSNTQMKVAIYSLFVIVVATLQSRCFLLHQSLEFRLFDRLSSLFFALYVVVFLLVILYVFSNNIYTFFFSNAGFVMILPSVMTFILIIWIVTVVRYRLRDEVML